ncbi:MAG: hypothetical protein ABIG39_04685 [Candidatus Micrarchaeota archaeon]
MQKNSKPTIVKRVVLAAGSPFSNWVKTRRARMFERWAGAADRVEVKVEKLEKAIKLHRRVANSSIRRGTVKETVQVLSGSRNFVRAFNAYGERARAFGLLGSAIAEAGDYGGAAVEYEKMAGAYVDQQNLTNFQPNRNIYSAETVTQIRINAADAYILKAEMHGKNASYSQDLKDWQEVLRALKQRIGATDAEMVFRQSSKDLGGLILALDRKDKTWRWVSSTYRYKLKDLESASHATQMARNAREARKSKQRNQKLTQVVSTVPKFDLEKYIAAGADRLSILRQQNVIRDE